MIDRPVKGQGGVPGIVIVVLAAPATFVAIIVVLMVINLFFGGYAEGTQQEQKYAG